MSRFINRNLLKALIARKTGMRLTEVTRVVDAHDELVRELVADGIKVRALGIGYFEVIYRTRSRRLSPMTGGFVEVPAKEMLVFRMSRRK
jgi:nucleoid DNA-binding protein